MSKPRKRPTVFSAEKVCWICKSPYVHKHHICGGVGRRPISEQEGLWVYLCPNHHNMSDFGVHFDKKLDTSLKQQAQMKWERREVEEYNAKHAEGIEKGDVAPMTVKDARKRFIATFYESYLGDEDE